MDLDSETYKSLNDIESRIGSMALAHELLYEIRNFAALDFPDYARKLCIHAFGLRKECINAA